METQASERHAMTTDTMPSINDQPPKSRWRWFRFSLRTLMLLVALAGIPMGWVGWKINRARNQGAVVAELQKMNAKFLYDYQVVRKNGDLAYGHLQPPGPKWLFDLLGKEYFIEVSQVTIIGQQATDETIALIAKLPGVLRVNLSTRRGITDSGLIHFAGMHNLEVVNLDSDRITGTGMVHLEGLRRLKSLGASGWITDASLEYISRLERLEVLNIADVAQITDIGLAHIAKLHNLKSLRLGSNGPYSASHRDGMRITDAGLVNLYGLKNLEVLILNAQATRTGMDKLRKALPNCQTRCYLNGMYVHE